MSFLFRDYPLGHRSVPDAPESAKHWSGHDPADPPTGSEQEDDLHDFICPKCNRPSFQDERGESGLCVNCHADSLSITPEQVMRFAGKEEVLEHLKVALPDAPEIGSAIVINGDRCKVVKTIETMPLLGSRSWPTLSITAEVIEKIPPAGGNGVEVAEPETESSPAKEPPPRPPKAPPEAPPFPETESEIQKLVEDVGPEAAGLLFVLNKLEKYFHPESPRRFGINK